MTTAIDRVLQQLPGARTSGPNQWMSKCPAHEDHQPSLAISLGSDDRVLLKCHAGCELDDVLTALSMKLRDLFPHEQQSSSQNGHEPPVEYVYRDGNGQPYNLVRKYPGPGKRFSQFRWDATAGRSGEWVAGLGDHKVIPYRFDEVKHARTVHPELPVWVAEGEKDVDTLWRHGCIATTNPMGAESWPKVAGIVEQNLAGADVVIVVDRDLPGYRHGLDVFESLIEVASSVTVYEPHKGKDITDHLETYGLQADDLNELSLPELLQRASDEPEPEAPAVTLLDPRTGRAVDAELTPLVEQQIAIQESRLVARAILAEQLFVAPPVPMTVKELLAHPPPITKSRIETILARDARATLVAPRKVGKTTVVVNVLRALTLGVKLFDRWTCDRCRVHVLNYEVTGFQFATWCDEAGVDLDAVTVSNFRGMANPMATARARRELAKQIKASGAEVLIVDPYSVASSGVVEREADNVAIRGWLAMLDELATDAGCTEVVLTVHGSFKAEDPDAARGGTSLEDWPDSIWRLSTDDAQERFFSAVGRDVDVEQDRLMFNHQNRRLSFGSRPVSKWQAGRQRDEQEVLRIVAKEPGINVTDLRDALPEGMKNRDKVNSCLKAMEAAGALVRVRVGDGKSILQYLPADAPSQP